MKASAFLLGKHSLSLEHPHIMGIINLTPDSFYAGSRPGPAPDDILRLAERMKNEGASILDLGGESTRPGATPPNEQEEIDRVLGAIENISAQLEIPLSVDTSNPKLMALAAQAGAAMVNDIRALQRPTTVETAAKYGMAVCLMHMQGEPQTMQKHPHYQNPVREITDFLCKRIKVCRDAGIKNILVDPGFGFGKTREHNRSLIKHLLQFKALGVPLLVGLSRKSFLGQITGRETDERLAATIASSALAVSQGAWMVRVHDVAPNLDAIRVAWEITKEQKQEQTS